MCEVKIECQLLHSDSFSRRAIQQLTTCSHFYTAHASRYHARFPSIMIDSSSADDLRIDLETLRKKNDHLSRDNALLREELALSQISIDHSSIIPRLKDEYEAAMKSLSDEMRSCRQWGTSMNTKLSELSEGIKHEKFQINTLKTFVEASVNDMTCAMKTSFTMVLLKYHDMIVKKDRQREEELAKKSVELKTKVGPLLDRISQLEQETEREREIMQRRIETITRQVQSLETAHAIEIKSHLGRIDDNRQNIKDLENNIAATLARLIAAEASNVDLDVRLQTSTIEHVECTEKLVLITCELDTVKSKNADLLSQLQQSRAQFDKMAATNDALQADMSSLLQRERSLQKEAGATSLDKNEMQLRLHSIQDKVRTLEAEHAERDAETVLLQEQIAAKEREKDMITLQKAKIALINTELSSRVDELEAMVTKLKGGMGDMESASQANLEKALKQSANLKRTADELESSVTSLRIDRDAALDRAKALELVQKDSKEKHQSATVVMQDSIDRLTLQLSQSNDIKKSLQLAQQTAAEREEEVFRLKETIRRECEERTEKMHEINILKEKLLRFAESQSNMEFSQTSTPHVKPPPSASFSTNNTMEGGPHDAAWLMHMRKAGKGGLKAGKKALH